MEGEADPNKNAFELACRVSQDKVWASQLCCHVSRRACFCAVSARPSSPRESSSHHPWA